MTMYTHGATRMTRWTRAGIVAVVAACWSAPLGARQQPLVDASGHVREEAYDHLRRTLSGTDVVYESIDGRRLKGWLNEVVAISRQSRDDGNRYWGRISGTKYEAMTADWTEAQFRRLGLEGIRRQPFDLRPQWFPTDWSLTATGGGQTLSFVSANPAMGSQAYPNGIGVEAVWPCGLLDTPPISSLREGGYRGVPKLYYKQE